MNARDGPTDGDELLRPLIRDGEIVQEFDLDEACARAEKDAERVSFPSR